MVQYTPLPCVLTQHQARKLLSGGTIAIKKSQCGAGGSHTIYVTSQQHNRLAKGNGIRLRFSGAQVSHNRKHGAGFGDWIKSNAKAAARKGVDVAADYAKGRASDAVRTAIGAVPVIGKPVGKLAAKGVEKGIDLAASALKNKVIGSGMKKRRGKKGEGFFGSVGNVFSSAGNVLDAGANKILGTGLYPAGYGGSLLPRPIKGVNSNAAGI